MFKKGGGSIVKRLLLLAATLWLCSPLISLAQMANNEVPEPPGNNQGSNVADRMARLEAETQALREELQRLREQTVRLPSVEATPASMAGANDVPAVPVAAPAPPPAQDAYLTMDEVRGEMKKFSWKKGDFTITPYGWIWGNSVYSSQRTSPGSYTLFVTSPSVDKDNEFIVDARNTRLGFDVGGPQIPLFGDAQCGGKVEIDFQNSVLSTENKATILLRHCYAEMKNEDYRFLVGQTWDVVSPLNPGMLMYSVGWDGGNIGYRRAQFRGERYLNFSDVSMVTVQASINQQVFEDSTTDKPIVVGGQPSNWPVCEGRVGWTIGERGKDCRPIVVGMSGHIGNEEYDSAIFGKNNFRRTWSGNLDARVPLTDYFGVQGECFVGENLGAFLGGIGQGIDPVTGSTIRSVGGWVEVWYDWTCRLHSHVGYSVDDPNNNDLHLASEKTYNQFYYANLIYDLSKNCLIGMEVSSWKTLYVDLDPGDSIRSEFVLKYGF
jgi:hypothetical protein